jgi:uncharacterized protein with HEPN domain
MPPEVLKLLKDMQDAANDIAAFAAGKSFDAFRQDKQLRRAIERCFEIVGEALSQLRKIDPIATQRITDWQAIIGFRNVLIHGYGQVDDAKTWDIVQSEVPVLLVDLYELMK